ncbi:MAG TPA: type 2 isopentenyl-diphosphate Delta-isomerase [Chloroflexia bacterium]|nr:type 2 isopentenyl-diphosphate Delta-isomerase [Chloroflexia bacterium]
MTIEQRKQDHIRICLEEDVQGEGLTAGFGGYRFLHQALPELDLDAVDCRLTLWGRPLGAPLLISSMTGGTERAADINRNLATAAETLGLAIGVGSQRAALLHPELAATYQVRTWAPTALVFANIGAVQLNYGWDVAECRRAIAMIGADALILHLNPLQEAVQPGGDTRFGGLAARIAAVCQALAADGVPVIAKEVGWGMAPETARRLWDAGVAAIDVAGAGGTSWSQVEAHRAPTPALRRVAEAFRGWGIPTAESLRLVRAAGIPAGRHLFASGGLRSGIDLAKALALGATLGGLARPFLEAAAVSDEATIAAGRQLIAELRISMFCIGAADLAALRSTPYLYETG